MRRIVPPDTKLFVTSRVGFELDAASEVWHCLRATGVCRDAEVHFPKRGKWWLRGVILMAFDGSAIDAVRAIKSYLIDRPWIMEYALRIIPVEAVAYSLEELKELVRELSGNKIGRESWAIRIGRHDALYKRKPLIEAIASSVEGGQVNLKKPEWIVNVEVIRDEFLVSVIKEEDIIRKVDIRKGRRKT